MRRSLSSLAFLSAFLLIGSGPLPQTPRQGAGTLSTSDLLRQAHAAFARHPSMQGDQAGTEATTRPAAEPRRPGLPGRPWR